MVARHSIERASRAIREFISSPSRSLAYASRVRAIVVSRAKPPPASHPRVSTHGYTGLCTRSDGYICSLFRRVFVFTGTLFTTG